jgi:hypothetical protein
MEESNRCFSTFVTFFNNGFCFALTLNTLGFLSSAFSLSKNVLLLYFSNRHCSAFWLNVKTEANTIKTNKVIFWFTILKFYDYKIRLLNAFNNAYGIYETFGIANKNIQINQLQKYIKLLKRKKEKLFAFKKE